MLRMFHGGVFRVVGVYIGLRSEIVILSDKGLIQKS